MSGALFHPCCLIWNKTVVEVMKIMATSFKMPYAYTAALSPSAPAASHCWPTPPPETPGHSQASLSQSLVGSLNSFLLGVVWPRFCLCSSRVWTPVLCKFCNQVLLASKDKFPGGSQSLCQMPRLENLLWALELQQHENFSGITVCSLGSSAWWLYDGVNGDLLKGGLVALARREKQNSKSSVALPYRIYSCSHLSWMRMVVSVSKLERASLFPCLIASGPSSFSGRLVKRS